MTKSGFEGVLHDIPAMDHLRYASLIDLAQEVYPLVGQTVIVHGSDLGCLMGVASDVSDLYYIIEKRNGETYWASAVGWISGLKDRLPEREYRACHLRDEAAVEMQIIVDEGLDRIWIAGNDPLSGEGRSLKDALVHCHTHIVKEARSTVGWIPSYLKRHIADIYPKNDPRVMMVRDALCSPDFTRIFISHEDVNLSEALDILDTLRDKENEKLRAYFQTQLRDLAEHVLTIGGDDTETLVDRVLEIPVRELARESELNVTGRHFEMARMLWPERDLHRPSDQDWDVVEHLMKVSPYTDFLLRDWLRENRWVIDRIEAHRANERLHPDWVPAAYLCAVARPARLRAGFPGRQSDLDLILSDAANKE